MAETLRLTDESWDMRSILDALESTGDLTDGPPYGTRYGKARTTPKLPRKLKKEQYRRMQQLGYRRFGPIVISGTF